MEEKSWYKSTTIQSVALIIVLVLLQIFTGDSQVADTIDKLEKVGGENKELVLQLMTLLAGGFAVRGRIKANTAIKKKNGNGNGGKTDATNG